LTQFETESKGASELIAVDDAVAKYGISRSTVFRLFKAGLARYRRPGDRKTYVSRKQLEDMISFRKVD
jgi:hypothetical protein